MCTAETAVRIWKNQRQIIRQQIPWLFDNLNTFEYYNFNYKQRKQYFDFVTQNVVFGLAMNDFEGSPVVSDTNFFRAFYGSSEYNVKTEAAKASKLVQSYVEESMKFGR